MLQFAHKIIDQKEIVSNQISIFIPDITVLKVGIIASKSSENTILF